MTERERLIELLNDWGNKENDGVRAESIADYLLQNGVVVPLCNEGDLVYVIRRKIKRPRGGFYTSICYSEKTIKVLASLGMAYVDCKKATKSDFDLIGKTVFLTRGEAEKALERRKE